MSIQTERFRPGHTGPRHSPRPAVLTASQRSALHAAALHEEGHLPPVVSRADQVRLEALGLAVGLSGRPERERVAVHSISPRCRITTAGRSRALQEPRARLWVIPCSAAKLDVAAAPAGEMYIGSYHVAARRAALACVSDASELVVLSAKFGLVRLDDRILHYDMKAGRKGTVTGKVLRRQAHLMALSGATVTVLAGKAYAQLAREVWPGLHHPVAGARGIGDHLAYFADLYAPRRRRARART
ncbi:DUF6884 domain-containing protein [Streptomyces sp. NPDC002586]